MRNGVAVVHSDSRVFTRVRVVVPVFTLVR